MNSEHGKKCSQWAATAGGCKDQHLFLDSHGSEDGIAKSGYTTLASAYMSQDVVRIEQVSHGGSRSGSDTMTKVREGATRHEQKKRRRGKR